MKFQRQSLSGPGMAASSVRFRSFAQHCMYVFNVTEKRCLTATMVMMTNQVHESSQSVDLTKIALRSNKIPDISSLRPTGAQSYELK